MPTPILDRERSAPVPKPPPGIPIWFKVLTWLGTAFFVYASTSSTFPTFRAFIKAIYLDWFISQADRTGIVVVLLALPVAYYASVAIHEMGHVIGGLLVGYRFRAIRVGPVLVQRPFAISRVRSPGALFSGHALTIPVTRAHVAWRDFVSALGGPLADLLVAAALLAAPAPLSLFNGYLLMFCLVFGLATLVPADTPDGVTDGRLIEWLLRGDKRAERRRAMMWLHADISNGVPASKSDAQLFRAATAVRDASSTTVMAHLFAFRRAWLDGRRDEAGGYLEIALEHWTHVGPSMREAIMSEAAVYQARHRKRTDLAEQWLADIGNAPIRAWTRPGPEAAIMEARGDYPGAIAKLHQLEGALSAAPASGAKDLSLAEVRDWREEIQAAAHASA